MSDTSTARPLTGRHVLIWLACFFGVVIAANAWFVTLSVRSFHGEDRQRPYQQGLEYNQTLQTRARQRAEGWKASVTFDNATLPMRLRLAVVKPDGTPVQGLKLTGVLQHPADTFHDTPFALKASGPGLYEGVIANAGHGRRNAVIRAGDGIAFETEHRLWLP